VSYTVGYAVVGYNQASRRPSLLPFCATLHDTRDEAEEEAAEERVRTAKVGRGETYVVAEVVALEEGDE
jgi:hypothetical protein